MESKQGFARYHPEAPWPCMRGNAQSTGISPVIGLGSGATPVDEGDGEIRHFRTGNSIFSTPVIGPDETIYVGSADGYFYALEPATGEQRWRFQTREVIDCAGSIAADGTIYFASCDACLYALDTRSGQERWRIDMLRDRRHFSLSTIYWWEANVVLGPTGLIYAPSDDFYLYAIDPRGEVRWAGLTGGPVWTAPAFGADGSVYIASFDTHAYAFDAGTGEVRWRSPTGNFVASSPAVGADGTVYFGSFDGHLYALDGKNGGIKWRLGTGGPIYASPALALDGTLYVGSSDGLFYAISTTRRDVKWTFYAGDAIRCSAALGPDPQGSSDYLIYFGSGAGEIYALDPMGRRRWSYNTIRRARTTEYPNINASMAIGRRGLATASANGDVIYVPYDAYLRLPDESFQLDPSDGYPVRGAFWYVVSSGGAAAPDPVPAIDETGPVVEAAPGQVISLKLLARREARTHLAKIDPKSVEVEISPPLEHQVTVLPDRSQINVIPLQIPEEGQIYRVRARTSAAGPDGEPMLFQGDQRFYMTPASCKPSADEVTRTPFTICRMAVYAPPIVPSFDQIGIASLTIDVRLLEVDPSRCTVVAWGVQKFGVTESGEAVGVPVPRHLYYPLSGLYRDGHLVLQSERCNFELTGFPVPLDSLRFSGSYDDRGLPGAGTSMAASYRLPGAADLLRFSGPAERPSAGELLRAGARSLWSAGHRLHELASRAGSWSPGGQPLYRFAPQVAEAARLSLPVAWDLLVRKRHAPWGLFDEEGQFHGVGTFQVTAKADPSDTPAVQRFELDRRRRRLVAVLDGAPPGAIPGILLVDALQGRPLFIDYNRLTRISRDDLLSVSLDLPLSVPLRSGQLRAILLCDTAPAGELTIG